MGKISEINIEKIPKTSNDKKIENKKKKQSRDEAKINNLER